MSKEKRQEIGRNSRMNEPVLTCPCGFKGTGPNMKRWHFDNCKHKVK
jgi:hypothetical protein